MSGALCDMSTRHVCGHSSPSAPGRALICNQSATPARKRLPRACSSQPRAFIDPHKDPAPPRGMSHYGHDGAMQTPPRARSPGGAASSVYAQGYHDPHNPTLVKPRTPSVPPRRYSYFDKIEAKSPRPQVGCIKPVGSAAQSSRLPTRNLNNLAPPAGRPKTAAVVPPPPDPHMRDEVSVPRSAAEEHVTITTPINDIFGSSGPLRHDVGCQAAPLPWHRFFFSETVGQDGSNASNPNPFFNHFDVLLDDPLMESSNDYIVTNEVPPWMFDNYQRIYYSNGGENLHVASRGVGKNGWASLKGQDITRGEACVVAEGNEAIRLDLAGFCSYVARLFPRTRQDHEPLLSLMRGIIKYQGGQIERARAEAEAVATRKCAAEVASRDAEIARLGEEGERAAAVHAAARGDLEGRLEKLQGEVVAMKTKLEGAQAALEEKTALVAEIDKLKKSAEDTKLLEAAFREEMSRLKTERAEDKATITRIETAKIRAEGKLAQLQKGAKKAEAEAEAAPDSMAGLTGAVAAMVKGLRGATSGLGLGAEGAAGLAAQLDELEREVGGVGDLEAGTALLTEKLERLFAGLATAAPAAAAEAAEAAEVAGGVEAPDAAGGGGDV